MHLVSPEDDQDHWQGSTNGSYLKHASESPTSNDQVAWPVECVHDLLRHAFAKFRDKTALICGDRTLSFGELSLLTDDIARALISRRCGPGDLVGVALDRSVELVASLIAVWSVGAAYVPIDPTLPGDRIGQMLEDAAPKIVITETQTNSAFNGQTILPMDSMRSIPPPDVNGKAPGTRHSSSNLAYVMYTSGSTGKPKGVEVTHSNVNNLLRSLQNDPGCAPTDRLLAITTVSFDMSVVEIFLPLITGATVVLAKTDEVKDPSALVSLMKRYEVTMMQGTPAIWQMLLDSGWQGEPRLHKIFCGGEALSRALADRLSDCADSVWNMYGPTEVTVYASIWRVKSGESIAIGRPVENYHLYVLDDNMEPVSPGSPGELCVGGAGVAKGYRNNAQLSREKFVHDPFRSGLMYRTGDIAKVVESGDVALMGRKDGQLKVRGYRVEVGDIETAIVQHEDISAAAVICEDDRLIAFCVPRTEVHGNALPLDQRMRPWLTKLLPAYMVPSFFIELAKFPITPNGKIDRRALLELTPRAPTVSLRPAETSAVEVVGVVLDIWKAVLGHDNISIEDSFFDVGGDSVRLIRVQKKIKESLGVLVSVPHLFEHFTIRRLAAHIQGTASEEMKIIQSMARLNPGASDGIAIVGMACRLPGNITTPEEFWKLLERGGDVIGEVPKERWDADEIYDPRPDAAGKSFCKRGGFLSDIDSFDAGFFGMSPREASNLDQAQYLMLETSWEAFERAGYTMERLQSSNTGVFIGTSNILGHLALNSNGGTTLSELDGYKVTGTAGGTMSGRISYHFGLHGPTMTVDTACSSSLVATHLACNALKQGECDLALVGGVSLMMNPGLHVEFSRLRGMSPDGRCRAFSADTEGTGWSEGSTVVVLKRLSDAQRDGDTIRGAIRGSAVNHDGRSASLTTPSGSAQQRLVRTALSAANLNPHHVDYVEAHGTATKLGDPIEATALGEVFGPGRAADQPLLIGSVKSNLGHTQAAAGLVGLLKVVMAMEHSTLPQTLHISKPNVAVDWHRANVMPVMESCAWNAQENRPRRAGVSAFGIGGTNAHVIVEEPPRKATDGRGETCLPASLPFLLSADSDEALHAQAEKLYRHISSTTDSLGDVAFSLATKRTHLRKRMVLMAGDRAELLDKLDSTNSKQSLKKDASEKKLAMLFTGQGSQYAEMGKDLASTHPVFAEAIREIAAHFDSELESPLLDVMWAEPGSAAAALLDRTDFAQPALFALELALWRFWQHLSVTPEFVLGHSLGELVAAHVAGIFDLSDACRLVAARGRLMQAQAGNFAMVSIEADALEVAESVQQLGRGDVVDIALRNAPNLTVISGHREAAKAIADIFAARGRRVGTVVDGHAFHSRYLDGALAEFRAVAERVNFRPPSLRIVSSVTGTEVGPGEMESAEYWVRQMREPVLFVDAVQTLGKCKANVFLELGPDKVLCGISAACLAASAEGTTTFWLHSLTRSRDAAPPFQRSICQLHLHRIRIDWVEYFRPFGCHPVPLPTYAFQRRPAARKTNTVISQNSTLTASVDNQTPARSHAAYQYEVGWKNAPAHMSPGEALDARRIAVLIPAGWRATPLAEAFTSAAKLCKINFDVIGRVEELHKVHRAVLCFWDSDDDLDQQTKHLVPLALAQLQHIVEKPIKTPLIWVTEHAVSTGTAEENRKLKVGVGSMLWAMARSARVEYPELQIRTLDLTEKIRDRVGMESQRESVEALGAAVFQDWIPECAHRGKDLWTPSLQPISIRQPPTKQPGHRLVREGGAVLITGGTGYLGSQVARWLAQNGVRDMVLVSRKGKMAPDCSTVIDELGEMGVNVKVLAGDVGTTAEVDAVMKVFDSGDMRPLRGVIHAAGVSDSGVLSSLTPQRFETTIVPKVHGAWLLHQATIHMDLDIFVMFSSVSGVLGMPGLANYAAANAFLDTLAHIRQGLGLPAASIAYGPWAGGQGMASRLAATTNTFLSRFGLDPLTRKDGLAILEDAVGRCESPLTVGAALNLDRVRQYYADQGVLVPHILKALIPMGPLTHESKYAPAPAPKPPTHGPKEDMYSLIKATTEGQHLGHVSAAVERIVCAALGMDERGELDFHTPLTQLFDSLTAMQVRNELCILTGLPLSPTFVLSQKNLHSLSQALVLSLRQAVAQAEGGDAEEAQSHPGAIDWRKLMEGCLDRGLDFSNTKSWQPDKPKEAVLTGATGFVGAFILQQLLEKGIPTYCLVRAPTDEEAFQRIRGTLESYDLWEKGFEQLIYPLPADISKPYLGLGREDFDAISKKADTIVHAAGKVDWVHHVDTYIGPNVISAHEVLRLASCGRPKVVHLISTISTIPRHLGHELTHGDMEHGYATSKYAAERLFSAARWRGAKTCIYRLPYVTASRKNGHFRMDRGDFLHNLILGCFELGSYPWVDSDMSIVLPVDYLAEVVGSIVTRDLDRIGKDYDFVNKQAQSVPEFFQMIAKMGSGDRYLGLNHDGSGGMKELPFAEWKYKFEVYVRDAQESQLAKIAPLLDRFTEENAWTMFTRCGVGENILGETDYPAPALDENWAAKYMGCVQGRAD
ncbi:hypothetical protein QBC34DRAFT_382330 [Podospora aff. communis PSN243]|uniref:Polyketide synthase n=1 Tax=Podospora aff. communis PSN243 TaxID=3040156 RepID=A0AAV9GJ08_9PEZI|nr:hypothetical protein QBC34DRAFT_382330 [Podospora aff. communis PSN243]